MIKNLNIDKEEKFQIVSNELSSLKIVLVNETRKT